jgi:uncharacterized protein YcaQ
LKEINLTKKEACRFILAHQNLLPPRQLQKENIFSFIKKAGCIQYDPLSRIARNADLVLQSRISDFQEKDLYKLLYEERTLLDGWDKMMAIWPTEDWPYFERRRKEFKNIYKKRKDLNEACREIREYLSQFDFISSKDIESPRQVGWSWAPTSVMRAALESMYHQGELSVHHKDGTRKYYGFSSRLVPSEILNKPDPNRTLEEHHDWLTLRRTGSQGLLWNRGGGGAWLGTNMNKSFRTASLERLTGSGDLIPVQIEEIGNPFYMGKDELPLLDKIREENYPVKGGAAFIAPLDNLLWDRDFIKDLFHFDYKWEVYTPEKKRKYGYYVLPVLWRDRFIARFEPVMDRKKGILKIENWWWEEEEQLTDEIKADLITALRNFKNFLGAHKVGLSRKHKMQEFSWIKEF